MTDRIKVSVSVAVFNPATATCVNGCTNCAGFTGLSIFDNPFAVAVGATHQLRATAYYSNGTPFDQTSASDWSSNNPAVATVATGVVSGVSPGALTISAFISLESPQTICWGQLDENGNPLSCPVMQQFAASDSGTVTPTISPGKGLIGTTVRVTVNGSGFGSNPTVNVGGTGITLTYSSKSDTQIVVDFKMDTASSTAGNHAVSVTGPGGTSSSVNFFVQVPTNFSAISVAPQVAFCDLGSTGYWAVAQYQVVDQSGVAIQVSGLTPQEHFTVNGTAAFAGFRPFADPPTTGGAGTFDDKPVGTCISPPPPPNRCADVVQTFNIVVPTGSGTIAYPISTVTTRRDCQQGIRVQVTPPTPASTFTLGTVN